MNPAKRVLLLHAGANELESLDDLSRAMDKLGMTVEVEDLESGQYDKILDAVARADSVVYWPAAAAG